jgi:hypothetical protein
VVITRVLQTSVLAEEFQEIIQDTVIVDGLDVVTIFRRSVTHRVVVSSVQIILSAVSASFYGFIERV